MAEHTSGDWEHGRFGSGGPIHLPLGLDYCEITQVGEMEILAFVFRPARSKAEGEANARLFAKAWLIPELVEALEDLISRFVKCAVASGTDPEFAEAAVEKHRTALAKANQPEN